VQAEADFKAISLELDDWRRLTDSWRYASLSEEDKAQLRSQLADLEAKCEEKKRLRDEASARLAETEVWPIEGTLETDASLRKMLTYVAELRDKVMEMNKLLNNMIARRNIQPQEPNPNGMAMDVDSRPSKRSRGASVDTRRDDQAVAVAELEHLHDKLRGFEQNLSDFENSVTQHDRELEEEVDSRLNDRITDIRGADVKPSMKSHAETLAGIEQNLNMTGDQVGELAEEVGQLILQSSAQKAELHRLKQENDLLKSQYTLVGCFFDRQILCF
jgi:predicted  nucleic acid-binding Zn-ribbon protein